MKKAILLLATTLILAGFSACSAAPKPAVLSPKEYDAIYKKHMISLSVGMIIAQPWQDANEIDPEHFVYYFQDCYYSSNGSLFDRWADGFIPAAELEAFSQEHFDVTVEHLRTNRYYSAEKNAYGFDGLGSTTDIEITNAVQTGERVSIDYDVTGPMDYTIARGTLEAELLDGDVLGDLKFLSNQLERSAQYYLDYPDGTNPIDRDGVLYLNSGGGRSGHLGRDGISRWYSGNNLADIIAYYENEALPMLEAAGTADTGTLGRWFWSGTYRGGKPLSIDVRPKYGSDRYIITAMYGEDAVADWAENVRNREYMRLPSLNDPVISYEYLSRPFYAGVLDSTWTMAENADVSSLMDFYASNLSEEERAEGAVNSFDAGEVESHVRRYFDISEESMRGSNKYDAAGGTYSYTPVERKETYRIVRVSSYGNPDSYDDFSPIRIVIAYDVMPSAEDDTVIWSGELEIELSEKGFQYLSNSKVYPQYPITQDAAYLDEITEKYLRPLMPAYGVGWKEWANPSEISADDLVNFCAFNNLLDLPTGPDLFADGFVNNHAPAEATEAAVQQYFDVAPEYLRTSRWYNFVSEDGERYDNEYIMLHGFGGGGTTRALHAEQEGDLLKITVGLFGPDDVLPDRPQKIVLLTVKISGDEFQYLSNELR